MGMSMFNDTVTLYNKYTDNGAEKWKRTVLRGVFWSSVEGAVMRKTGAASADSVVIVIPRRIAQGAGYYKPKAWEARADKSASWTLRAGDTVVKGELDLDIMRSAAKELSGYDDVLTITTVDDKDYGSRMAHWEVSGK